MEGYAYWIVVKMSYLIYYRYAIREDVDSPIRGLAYAKYRVNRTRKRQIKWANEHSDGRI